MSEELRRQTKERRLHAMPIIGKEITDYCIEHDIENIIFLDRSARPAYMAFKTDWEHSQKEKRPNIYFMTPKMMESYGVDEQVINQFKEEQPYLSESKDKPTLIFDVCIKEGGTLENMTNLLIQSGFKDVHSMVTAKHEEKTQYFTPDKILFDNHKLGCHLFGAFFNNEVGVHRNENSLLATYDGDKTENVVANRKAIKQKVQEAYRQ